jgi:hypothetical protein
MPLQFRTIKRPELSFDKIEKAKQLALEQIGNLIFQELFVLTSGRVGGDKDAVGAKTGTLRRSLRMDFIGDEVHVYFNPSEAVHAGFVIEGTRFITGRNIINTALNRVSDSQEFQQVKKDFFKNAFG